jgi:outer membrane protein TolC
MKALSSKPAEKNRASVSFVIVLLGSILFTSSLVRKAEAQTLSVEDVISLARQNSETLQANEKTIQAISAEISGRDLVLSWRLDSEIADARDQRDTLTPTQRFRTKLIDASLNKLFSTGTQLGISIGSEVTDLGATGERNIGEWELKLSQSLWRDGFGRSTSLRREAERAELQSRTLTTLFQRQNFLVELESAYWDLALALREEEIREGNIEKSEQVERWTRDRVRRSVAEPADLLQAQALTSNRQLELISVRNRIDSLRNRFRQLIPNQNPDAWKIDLKSMEVTRPLDSLLAFSTGSSTPLRLDSLSTRFLAEQAAAEASRVDENLQPKLDAYVSYGQNGRDERLGAAWDRARDPEFSSTRIGVLFSMDLDSGLKEDQRRAARLNAESRSLEARAQERLSVVGWSDLNREIESLKKQAEEANRLAEFQERKVAAERNRYRLGRTTVFQLITFEIDAANSKVELARILSNLRKAESRARVFTRQQDGV